MVDKVNFDIHDNEVFGLIGPNGSGKTTVLDLVSGLLRLSSAKIISYDKYNIMIYNIYKK